MVGDVGRILGENVAHDLIDGIIALFLESFVDGGEDVVYLLLLILCRVELTGKFVHVGTAFLIFSISLLVYALFPEL